MSIHLMKGYFFRCRVNDKIFEYIFSNLESKAYEKVITYITTFKRFSVKSKYVVTEGSVSKGTFSTWEHPIFIVNRIEIKKEDITREIIEKTLGITSKEWNILNKNDIFGKKLVNCFYNTIINMDRFYIDEKEIDLNTNPIIYVHEFISLLKEKTTTYTQQQLVEPTRPELIDPMIILQSIYDYKGLKAVPPNFLADFIERKTGYPRLLIFDYLEQFVEKGYLLQLGNSIFYIQFDKIKEVLKIYKESKKKEEESKKKPEKKPKEKSERKIPFIK